MSLIRRITAEPLLHFLALGAVLFLVYGALDDSPDEPGDAIVVTEAQVERLTGGFEAAWRRAPTDEERSGLMEDFVREEVLVREALALGLDNGDTVVRRRLRQKMEFISAAAAESIEPSEEELAAFYEAEVDRFADPPLVAFSQVFLGETATPEEVAAAMQALNAGADPVEIGRRTLLPSNQTLAGRIQVDGAFGQGVFDQLYALEPDGWHGPIRSGFGVHIAEVVDRREAVVAPLADIRGAVLREWRAGRAREIEQARYERLRSRYEVRLP